MNKILLLILSVVVSESTFCQTKIGHVPPDSIAHWELSKIYYPLKLDSNQSIQFLLALKSKLYELDDLNKVSSLVSERKLKITDINKKFDKYIKDIFSATQYKNYKDGQQKEQQLFRQKMIQKGIKVEDIED